MTPTRPVRTEEITANGRAKAPDAAANDALLRELQALRRSEAVLRDFIETSTIGLHWVGGDGTILWANQAELDLLGYAREQYIGRNITEFHADGAVIDDILACLSRGEILRDRPARLRHRDGSIRHVLINSSVLFEDGEFVHTRCFTRDITELKQEQATRQAQLAAELADTKLLRDISAQLIEPGDENALYGKIVDAVAAIMRSDFATMQVLYPERGPKGELRLLASRGLTPEGCKVWEWVRFDTDSTCGQVLRTGKRAIAADIETCDFLAGTGGMAALLEAGIHAAQSTPLISRSGKMLGMISSHWSKPHAPTERDLRLLDILARQAADLIERRQAEQALRESKRRLHEIIEAIPAAVYTTDADGRITFFNQAAVEFSGRVPEVGTDSWCVTWKLYNTDGTPLPHDQCPMAVALTEKRPVLGCEAVAERPDGQRRIFTPYPTPLFDAQGRLTGAVNMLVDITERKRAEDILRESEERFRAIVETTPECVKVVAADGTLLLMNEAGLGMVGAAVAEDVTRRSVYDLIAPEDRETYCAFNERVCAGEKGSLEFDIVGLKGRRCRMETHAVPLRRPDGSIVQLGITRDITERRKAEEMRLLLGAIVGSSDDAIVSKNLNGVITSWNNSASRLFGYTADEAIGQTVASLLIPADRQSEEPEILARLKRGERVDHFETVRRRKDGSLLDLSLTISPVKDAHGTIIGASKIARDITERKRNEQAIQSLNEQLKHDLAAMTHLQRLSTRLVEVHDVTKLLEEIVAVAIEITAAHKGNIQLLDDGVLRIVAQRNFDQPFLDFFDEVHDGQAACGAALRQGGRVVIEDVAGSEVYDDAARKTMLDAQALGVQSTPLVTRSGEILGMFSTHYARAGKIPERDLRWLDLLARLAADLIERRRADHALRASEERFRIAQSAAKIGAFDWNIQAGLNTWSPELEQLYGLEPGSFAGTQQAWERLVHPEDRDVAVKKVEEAFSTPLPVEAEWRVVWPDGTVHWLAGRFQVYRDDSGAPMRLSGVNFEITKRKRIEDELRRANQDLEQFAYSASHDLQEPLRTIKIYSALLADRLGTAVEGESAEFLDFLQSAATRMELLVRDLLAYTQVTRFDAKLEETDANQTLAETLVNLGGAIAQSGAAVTSDRLPVLGAHGTHLRQLFQNLIGNAIKYRSEDRTPTVHIGAERQDGYWLFTVRDNGIGIPPEFKEQIFGLFTRLHNADRYAGTGIGLAICQRIVERYHGRIWVESEPGRGSQFRFTLPV